MNTEQFRKVLKENRCRVTKARLEIFELLKKASSSMNVKEVFKGLNQDSSTDLVSVYRNLTLFSEMGLAHKFQDGSFALCTHNEEFHSHVHFIVHCTDCGKKSEMENQSKEMARIALQLKKVSRDLETFHEVIVQGHCFQCS